MLRQSYFIRFILCAILTCTISAGFGQFYDGSNMEFGKNRVQLRAFEWQYLPTPRAEVYYYQGGKAYANRITSEIKDWIEDVEELYDRSIEGTVQILVYNKQAEFRQSNIGSGQMNAQNIGGTATLVGSKLFVYADGVWEHTEDDIKRSLSNLLFNQILYGSNWQEALRSSTTGISFPAWFTTGLHSYVAHPWSATVALHVWDAARCKEIIHANRATGIEARWVGHGVWKYIADVFGEPVIANALYMVRVSSNLEKGLQYATGMNLELLLEEANQYHLDAAGPANQFPALASRKDLRKARKNTGALDLPIQTDVEFRALTVHPDGNRYAWAREERGQLEIWIGDRTSGDAKRVGRHGHKIDRIQDRTLPAMAWHPNGNILTYALEQGSQNLIYSVDLTSFESVEKEVFRIDKILSMAYAPDGMSMVWSAVKDGQSDLYQYQILGNNHTALWSDPYDDLNPVFSKTGRTIWFASNRPDIDLNHEFVLGEPVNSNHDLFAFQWTNDTPQLIHWIETPQRDESFPQVQFDDNITFLVELEDGSQERWISWRDSAVAYIDTTIHYRRFTQQRMAAKLEQPAEQFQWIPSRKSAGFSCKLTGHPFWVEKTENKEDWKDVTPGTADAVEAANVQLDWEWTPGPTEADFRNYTFGPWSSSSQIDAENEKELEDPARTALDWKPFKLPKPRNYRLNYAIESITGQLDNSFGSTFYQAYGGNIAVQPGLGGLSQISVADLFENRRFTAGFRLAGSLENSRYLFAYSDLKGRWDKTWMIERQGITQGIDNNQTFIRTHIHMLRRQWKYALDEVRSFRIQGVYRLDRITPLSTDAFNLTKPTQFAGQAGALIAYVFDNIRERMINIPEGMRYRVWAEYYVNPIASESTFGTTGFDLRIYKPVWRNVIWANRLAADWSIGELRLLHMIGGVDNTLSLISNAESPIDPNINYAYQSRLAPLRGFNTNARNGSHMALFNSELRIPIWSTLSSHPIDTELLQTLQFVGFFDVGSAWNGKHPYDNTNTFNQVTVTQNPITVTIDNNREPIIWGTGFGLRGKVLGYWLRADWSWGVDDGRWQERIFNLSLQLDF